jgi:L-aspartate oxidase
MTKDSQKRFKSDYLIIGSGIAGLFAALKAAAFGTVNVVTKRDITDCNTMYAQGGIACVIDEGDSIESHIHDTLTAGGGLCKKEVVSAIISEGPSLVNELVDMGIQFTRRNELGQDASESSGEEYDLGKEGGHSYRRVLHSGDITGNEIIRGLSDACERNSRITLFRNFHAVDLISSRRLDWDGANRCLGVYVMDRKSKVVHTFLSKFVFLATGGAGKAYLYTSNPDVACGEGVAMAYRAYAEIANMEFYQFHPTCLFHPEAKSFLISEAVRGEGAVLKTVRNGSYVEFMDEYHELASLAPRDIVARAIDRELKKSGQPCVFLDIRHHSENYLRKRFPNIFEKCLHFGFNLSNDLIPVVPAAHYCCGGVRTDVNGKTCVDNLYALGEVGCTGFHGANRLASNSLLESIVVANNAVKETGVFFDDVDSRHLEDVSTRKISHWSSGDAIDADELIVVYHNWDEIRRFMWDYVGIYRTTKRLLRAKTRIRNIRKEIEHFYWDFIITADLIELRNMASVAEMIIDSALSRHHSIGLHFNSDCPPAVQPITQIETILRRPGFEKELH